MIDSYELAKAVCALSFEKRIEKETNANDLDGSIDIYPYLSDKEEVLNIKNPIERIMGAILIGCYNGSSFFSFCEAYPFEPSTIICTQEKIGNYRVDFIVSTTICNPYSYKEKVLSNIIIECDGHDFHEKTKEQAKYDKKRDRYLTNLGYKVLHFTGSEIYNDFSSIAQEIENAVKSDIKGGKDE